MTLKAESRRTPVTDDGADPGNSRRMPGWLWAMVAAYAVVFGALSVLKHNTFHSYTFDLGIMSQVLWNTGHGRVFEVSLGRQLDQALIGNYLGNHVRPVLFLLAPLYRLWPDPRQLLILQSVVLALGAVPLFWVARRYLGNPLLQKISVITYLLYPALGYLNFFDFHPIATSIPLILMAYWALLEDRPTVFWSAILLAMATKEEMVVPLAAFAVYCLTRSEWRRKGAFLLAVSALWAFLCFAIIIPHFNEGRPYRFFEMWSHLRSLLSNPAAIQVEPIGESGPVLFDALAFVFHLLLPLGFLPLLKPGLLAVCLPSLAYLLVGSDPALRRIGNQYAAVLIPWLFLAAVEGLARLAPKLRPYGRAGAPMLLRAFLLAGTVGGIVGLNPILFNWLNQNLSPLPHQQQLTTAIALIPDQAGVATINSLGAHVAHRQSLISLDRYDLPLRLDHLEMVDYVLLDLVDCQAVAEPDPRPAYAERVLQVLQTGQFRVAYWEERVILLERGTATESELDAVAEYVDAMVDEGRPCWP